MAIKNFYRGDSQYFYITVVDDGGNPIDLTGATIYFTMKRNLSDSDTASGTLQIVVTTHLDPTLGLSLVELSSADSLSVLVGDIYYFYDFVVLLASGDVGTLDNSKVKVLANVTGAV